MRLGVRAYGVFVFPYIFLKRYVLWPSRGWRWRDWIDEHVLLGGLVFRGDVPALKQEGIAAVVDLCAEFEDPLAQLRAAGIDHLHLPTPDMRPPAKEDLARAVAFIAERADRGAKTYVHCASGLGRSVTVAACWLVRQGRTTDEAFRTIREKHPASGPRPSQVEAVRAFERDLRPQAELDPRGGAP